MNDLFAWALSLPNFALVGIAGGIGGAIGALLAAAVQKLFGLKKAWGIIPIIFVVGAVQLTNKTLLPLLQKEAGPYEAIRVMKQSPIFNVIFKYHPDAEAETAQKLKELASGPGTNRGASARAIGAALADKYVNMHVLMASDDAVRNMLVSEEAILRSVRSQPDACVALYLGNINAPVEKVAPELLNAKVNARANVIETSVTQPSPPLTAITVDALGKILARVYQAKGFNIGEISKLEDVSALPPKEGCEVAYHFTSAMAALDPKEAATVYKGLLVLAKQ
jgi:hypothetical protein